MATQIVNRDGKDFPMVFCDHCKLLIEEAEQANAIWPGDGRREDGFCLDVGHVHKKCDDLFQLKHAAPPGSQWHWQGLNHHFIMLLANCGYDEQRARRSKKLLDGLEF